MTTRVLPIALALIAMTGMASADGSQGSDYTHSGPYAAVGAAFADPWDLDGTSTASGVAGRFGVRFDQGRAWVGGGIEVWGRATFTHSNDIQSGLVLWSVNIGPILWFRQGRLQPFVRLGMGGTGLREERGGSDQNSRSIGVSFGTGIDYYLTETLAVYAMFDYESPLTNESKLDNLDTFGGGVGLKLGF
jgi:hypothetical protein